jgi:hypothetical protein
MLTKLLRNRLYYLTLFGGLVLGLITFFGVFGIPQLRQESIIGLCVFYFVWGISHHLIEKDLHRKIILEYFLVASVACLILLSLLWRA